MANLYNYLEKPTFGNHQSLVFVQLSVVRTSIAKKYFFEDI